jgi:hypothetical protein
VIDRPVTSVWPEPLASLSCTFSTVAYAAVAAVNGENTTSIEAYLNPAQSISCECVAEAATLAVAFVTLLLPEAWFMCQSLQGGVRIKRA